MTVRQDVLTQNLPRVELASKGWDIGGGGFRPCFDVVHIVLLGIVLSYSWQQRKQKDKQSKDCRDKCDREKPN